MDIKSFNVKDYGAAGNGIAMDTSAIQKTIDACALSGGGAVLFPAGTYLSGTVYLKDNVCLELEPGSVLRGSTDKRDYNTDDFCPQNAFSAAEKASGAHLVVGVEVKNISIRGGGRIDGSGQAFFRVPEGRPDRFEIPGWRPGQMIFLCECENVRIEGVELFNSPYWSCFLYGCENVFVRGLRIWNDPRTINGDGLDVDCCRQVVISDCLIETGDDCITLRGNVKRLKNPGPCEDVAVSNCILKTRANGVRIGVGSGVIRQAAFSNLIIGGNALDGICIQSNYCAPNIKGQEGVEIKDILFENILMTDVISALYVAPGYARGKSISHIYIRGLRARAKKGSLVRGSVSTPLRHAVLSDINISTSGQEEYLLDPGKMDQPLFEWNGCMPAALFMADCEDVEIENSSFDWGDTSGKWLYTLWGKRLSGCRLNGVRLEPPPGSTVPLQMDECDKNCVVHTL